MSDEQGDGVTRRQALAVGLVGAATLAAASSMSGDTQQTGAAGEDRGSLAYNGTMLGIRLSAYHFG